MSVHFSLNDNNRMYGVQVVTSEKEITGTLRILYECYSSSIFEEYWWNGIGIIHVFSSINICQVPRKKFEREALGLVFKLLPRDPANVNALKQTCLIFILALYMIPWKLTSKTPEKSWKSHFDCTAYICWRHFVFHYFWHHMQKMKWH